MHVMHVAVSKSKNSHNVRLLSPNQKTLTMFVYTILCGKLIKIDQDPQKHIQTSIATVAATGNTIQF